MTSSRVAPGTPPDNRTPGRSRRSPESTPPTPAAVGLPAPGPHMKRLARFGRQYRDKVPDRRASLPGKRELSAGSSVRNRDRRCNYEHIAGFSPSLVSLEYELARDSPTAGEPAAYSGEPAPRRIRTLPNQNPAEPEPCRTRTLSNQNPVEPEPCRTRTLSNQNPVEPEPCRTLQNLVEPCRTQFTEPQEILAAPF
jgi:hypothetical protein